MAIKARHLIVIVFSLFFSIYAYLINPPVEYDLYRHYEYIDSLKGFSFNEALLYGKSGYTLLTIYSWFVNTLGLKSEFIPFTVVFISYVLVFSVLLDIKKKFFIPERSALFFLVFLIFWLSICFIPITSGLRNGFANVLIFYASYHLIYNQKKLRFILLSSLALLAHPFVIAVITLVVLCFVFKRFSTLGKFLIVIAIAVIVLNNYVVFMISFISEQLLGYGFKKGVYFSEDGEWGGGYSDTRSLRGWIGYYVLHHLPFYTALLYLSFSKSNKNDSLYLLLCALSLYLCFFFQYYTLFNRMMYVYIFLFSVYLVDRLTTKNTKKDRLYLYLYLLSLIMYSLINIYGYREFVFSIFV